MLRHEFICFFSKKSVTPNSYCANTIRFRIKKNRFNISTDINRNIKKNAEIGLNCLHGRNLDANSDIHSLKKSSSLHRK